MIIREIIQRIQSLYSKGVQSDDTRLSNRHIYNKLLTLRARLVTLELKKKQRISQWNYQTIPCVELIITPSHECPCIPPLGCDVVRSKYKLPKPLSGFSSSLIQSVTTIDRSIKIDEVSINVVKSLVGNKYSSSKLNFFIQSGYLYITTPTKIEVVTVTGLFEDPLEVSNFKNYCENEIDANCTDCQECKELQDKEFPIDNDMIDALVEMSVAELIQVFGQGVEDLTNNSRDSLKEQSK